MRVELSYGGQSKFVLTTSFLLVARVTTMASQLGRTVDIRRFFDHNGHQFSTYDRDNDYSSSRNSAKKYIAAWSSRKERNTLNIADVDFLFLRRSTS
ncbi:hypothetical protein RRG08_037835 [Elysia crispata]|uniref:Fibrinogen C-terminal domain-containing protein n=1 Tax=Elysia crispata TaxID=231223 RepID=A0AAE0YUL5_9GAST|nr:hypothetical protein RRG08_037835 [Elysia crispata]